MVNSVTGAGIPDVAVTIFRNGGKAYGITTGAQGGFEIPDVPEGAYTACFKAHDYWAIREPCINQPFSVAAASAAHLTFAMTPIGKISGRVLDASGKPVPRATLQAGMVSGGAGIFLTFAADEKGGYHTPESMLPGTWTLSAAAPESLPPPDAEGEERRGWSRTYYARETDASLATPIVVPPGGEVAGLDIKLETVPVHRVRGRVLDLRGEPVPSAAVTFAESGAVLMPSLHQETKADGWFEFPSVADAEWTLCARVDWEGVKLWALDHVRVKGRDLEDVKLQLAAPVSIAGKVVMEAQDGMPTPMSANVGLIFSDTSRDVGPPGGFINARPDNKGEFTLKNVYPGAYLMALNPAPASYYLDSIRLGSRDVLDTDLQIQSGAAPITITYKLHGGSVHGAVENCGSGRIWLIPQDEVLRRDEFIHSALCGSNDRFEINDVRPGEYYALAIATKNLAPSINTRHLDQELMNQSARVTVRANETTSADLRLVTR